MLILILVMITLFLLAGATIWIAAAKIVAETDPNYLPKPKAPCQCIDCKCEFTCQCKSCRAA